MVTQNPRMAAKKTKRKSPKKATKKRSTAKRPRRKVRAKKKAAAAKSSSPAMDLIVAALKKNKKAAYADIKTAADKKRLQIYPIMFGRAQLLLGIAKAKPKKKASGRGPGSPKGSKNKRRPGRPRKNGRGPGRPRRVSAPLAAVQELVSTIEQHARDNHALRETLLKMRELIDRVV